MLFFLIQNIQPFSKFKIFKWSILICRNFSIFFLSFIFKNIKANWLTSFVVLSAGAWVRGLSRFPIQLPHEIEEKLGSVEEFYKEQHSGRKLNFHPLLSHGTLTFQSKLGKYELEVSAMQLAILQCWNRRPNAQLSIEELVLGKFITVRFIQSLL